MSLQHQVTWKGIIVITLTVLLMPLAGLGADLEENMIKAAYWGDAIVVKDCLSKGANINGKLERSGWTALMLAASEGHVEILRFLLAGGADVNARSAWGNTALYRAARNGKIKCVKALLAEGAEVNTKCRDRFTPLIIGAYHGETDVVRILLAHGADVTARSDLGHTALSKAKDGGHAEIITMLREAGAKE